MHKSTAFLSWLNDQLPASIPLFIPAVATGKFQPMDVALNRQFKSSLRASTRSYLAQQVILQRQAAKAPDDIHVDTALCTMRPYLPGWIYFAHKRLSDNPSTLFEGFKKA